MDPWSISLVLSFLNIVLPKCLFLCQLSRILWTAFITLWKGKLAHGDFIYTGTAGNQHSNILANEAWLQKKRVTESQFFLKYNVFLLPETFECLFFLPLLILTKIVIPYQISAIRVVLQSFLLQPKNRNAENLKKPYSYRIRKKKEIWGNSGATYRWLIRSIQWKDKNQRPVRVEWKDQGKSGSKDNGSKAMFSRILILMAAENSSSYIFK